LALFIRVDLGFYTHRKTLRLFAKIGESAFWVPPRLWSYAASQQTDGVFKSYSANEIAMLIGYNKDATSMLQALIETGFMDPDPLRIHDWEDHNGFHAVFSERAKKAARSRWKKEDREEKRGEEKAQASPSNASSMLQASKELEIPQNLRTESFLATWEEWVVFRKKRAACKDWIRMFQKQLQFLGKFPEDTARAILDQSMMNNYQGLFEIKAAQASKSNGTQRPLSLQDIRTIIQAKEGKCAELKRKYCSEVATGDVWSDQERRREYLELRKQIKALNNQISDMA
jgi:hypothetical protein